MAAERVDVDFLALFDARPDEVDDRIVRKAGDFRDDGADRAELGMARQRSELKPVLAVGRASDVPERPLRPVGGDVVPLGEGGERHRGDPAVVVPRESGRRRR